MSKKIKLSFSQFIHAEVEYRKAGLGRLGTAQLVVDDVQGAQAKMALNFEGL